MAVSVPAGDYLRRSANVPSPTSFTICGWVKQTASPTAIASIFAIDRLTSHYCELVWDNADSQWHIENNSGDKANLIAPTNNVWYFLAFTCEGTGSTDLKGYVSAEASSGWDGTGSVAGKAFTSTVLTIGSNNFTQPMNGCEFSNILVYNSALSSAALLNQKRRFLPFVTANINIWSPFIDTGENDFIDYSGNGRNWTETGTVSTGAADPPISWGAPSRRIIIPLGAASTPRTKTLSLNALIQKQDILATASLGAMVQKQGITATASLDAQVMAEQLVTAALNALIKAEGVTASTDLNALIQIALAQTVGLDSVIDLQMSHHWRFENGFTDSAGSWNLTAVNSPGFTQGAPNKKAGLDLVGASDQLAWSDNDFTGVGAITITGFFKANATGAFENVISALNAAGADNIQFSLSKNANNTLGLWWRTDDTSELFTTSTGTEEATADVFHFFAIVFDGAANSLKLYIDQSAALDTLETWLDETTAGTALSAPAGGAADFAVGAVRNTTTTWVSSVTFDGQIDDVRIYPGVLDSTELAAVRDEVQGSLLIPSLDALIQALATDTVNLDALIQAAAIATAQLDGLIKVEGATVTTDLDALLQATQSVTTDLDALLQARQTETTDLGALLLKALSVSTALDAVLIDAGVTTVTTNLDTLIKALGLTVSTGLDALVQTSASESTSLDAMIQAQASLTASLTAVLKREGVTVSSSVDGLISAALTRSASLDALVQIRQALTTSLDAVLVLGINLVQASLDALIQGRVTASASLDAVLVPPTILIHTSRLAGILKLMSSLSGTHKPQTNLGGEIDDSS